MGEVEPPAATAGKEQTREPAKPSAWRRVLKALPIAAVVGAAIYWVVPRVMPDLWIGLLGQDPISVHVEPDPAVFEGREPDWTGYTYIIPRAVGEIGEPPEGECRGRRSWAYELGGADVYFTRIQLTLEGRLPSTVLIDDVRVRVVKRQKPLTGVWAQCPVGGADVTVRGVKVNLDGKPPRVGYSKNAGVAPTTFRPLRLQLAEGEVEVLFLEARAKRCYCEWVAQLDLIVRGKRMSIIIDDDGRPFRTTGWKNAQPFTWWESEWQRG